MAEEPRWLDDDQQDAWLPFVQMLMRLPGALDSQLQQGASMSHFEYLVLAVLSMREDRRCHLRDVARMAGSSLPRLSNVVTRLEQRGWVVREGDPVDRRSTYAVLTDQGAAQLEAAAPVHVAGVRALVVDRLTPAQLRTLGEAAEAILAAVDGSVDGAG
ncbi:MarR family transcriptional regulator [Nocardioidaceae bacterium]|nr:MarR family transcriptional regulator [Nocardioidaceae bacterium]